MDKKRVPLYERLPEIYRIKDQEQNPPGQLERVVGLVENVFGAIHGDIEGLYDNLFIETCDDWVIPYIGDLLGTSHLNGDTWTLRADVADTVALRRRKGTLGAIELLTYDLTEWGVHCVELRENLVWNQHLNHQRPDRGGIPPYGVGHDVPLQSLDDYRNALGQLALVTTNVPVGGHTFFAGRILAIIGNNVTLLVDGQGKTVGFGHIVSARLAGTDRNSVVRGGTVTLRDPATLTLLNTPFDLFGHTADLKPPTFGAVRYNLPNLAIFLWRLGAYQVPVSRPMPPAVDPIGVNSTASGIQAHRIVRFNIHPVGEPVQLFNTGRYGSQRQPPVLTREDEVPGPMPAARLCQCSPAGNPGEYVTVEPYDAGPPIQVPIFEVGLQLHIPPRNSWPKGWLIRGANLCAWEAGLALPLAKYEVVVDPAIGRLAIGVASHAEAVALQKGLFVTYTYGAVGPVGAHPISRAATPTEWNDEEVESPPRRVDCLKDPGYDLSNALGSIENSAKPTAIEFGDSLVHDLDVGSVSGAVNEGGKDTLRLNRTLIIRAADGQRPIIRLKQPLRFRPTNVLSVKSDPIERATEQEEFDRINAGLTVRLEGLYITRGDGFPGGEPLIARAALNSLELLDCTLDPGGFEKLCGERAPVCTSVRLDNSYGFAGPAEYEAFDETPAIILQRTITGPLFIDPDYTLDLTRSIIDAGNGVNDDPATSAFAVSGVGLPEATWGPPTRVDGVTVFGRMRAENLSGRGGIWTLPLWVWNNQKGCIKFSYFCETGNRLPQNHGCVWGDDARLRFTSEIFGQPAYGQLAPGTDFRIRERGPGDDAMGAFGFLLEAHKWRNLQKRFREFMPVGVRPLTIPIT